MTRVVPAALLLLVAPWFAACGSPIVGGECRKGYSVCDGRCVRLDEDPLDCGSCGHSCGGFTCSAGKCTHKLQPDSGLDASSGPADGGGARDTGTMPATDSGSTRPDAGTNRGGVGAPFLPDGGIVFPDPDVMMMGCPLGQTRCDNACVDTRYDAQHCGDCATACGTDQFCKLGTCTNFCDPPLSHCGGACVDEMLDENHCGSCDTVCVSGICDAGKCADVIPGSLVVIGHDYTTPVAQLASIQRVAGNALFLPHGPVHALVYTGSADPKSVTGVNTAFDAVAKEAGRQWTPTQADPDHVSEQLRDVNAFVIYAQNNASDMELVTLGTKWGLPMTQFLLRGGVVILFDTETTSSKNIGTYRLLQPSGLFTASGRQKLTGSAQQAVPQVRVVSPGDSVANNVSRTYSATASSVRFANIMTSDGTVVVETYSSANPMQPGDAVVFHRVISPP